MDIQEPLKDLGTVAVTELKHALLALDEDTWQEERVRQTRYHEVHYNTESVLLVFCNHDDWPAIDVVKGHGWERLAELALPLMHGIIAQHYAPGGTIIRAMAAKLKAGTTITPHTDNHPSFRHSHRIHIPITTNRKVRFMIDGRPHRMAIGHAYEINNQKRHGVINGGDEDRITFIFDYIPGQQAA
ncbi:MAG: aspartyl/asparaginyl beta-hydroxylase domain-containing protein [Pseudomonadales bacterium]|nr:aspartyl/asparaginyl beta-hydroxylase domain-containing protein [Pseudomonadales bacterium]